MLAPAFQGLAKWLPINRPCPRSPACSSHTEQTQSSLCHRPNTWAPHCGAEHNQPIATATAPRGYAARSAVAEILVGSGGEWWVSELSTRSGGQLGTFVSRGSVQAG
jgi:hypothetical protein